jgi:hypothetical protein
VRRTTIESAPSTGSARRVRCRYCGEQRVPELYCVGCGAVLPFDDGPKFFVPTGIRFEVCSFMPFDSLLIVSNCRAVGMIRNFVAD